MITINRSDLERSGALRLDEAIGRLPWNYAGAATGPATVPNGMPAYGTGTALADLSGASPGLAQTGVSAAGLRGLGAGGTLVLIDGRRAPLSTQADTASNAGTGFYDLSAIPLGLVERVEILPDSASAAHGADAIGGVINIVLRRDYTGGEFSAGLRGAEHGGGFERQATLVTGFARGSFNLLASVAAYDRNSLRASQRAWSANQDRRAQGGRDFRLSVGSPAVIAAAAGTLNGLSLAGSPVRFALVRVGQNGSAPTLGNFEPVAAATASNLRRYDTSATKDLLGAATQVGVHLAANYAFSSRFQSFGQVTQSSNTTETANEPPATLGASFGGANSRVPAAHPRNPFGQDVVVSLVHVEAPPRPQIVDTTNRRLTAGLRGRWGDDWRWEAAATLAREDFESRTLELRADRLLAALADGRFNPFGDPAAGAINATVYADLMSPVIVAGASRIYAADFTASGPVATLRGGKMLLATGGEFDRAKRDRQSTDPRSGQDAASHTARDNTALFAELSAPLVGAANARSGVRRLDLRFAVRHERASAFQESVPRGEVRWSPVTALALQVSEAAGFRPPALSEFERTASSTSIVINDPRRGESYAVTRRRGANPGAQPETSRSRRYGLTLAPPWARGLKLQAYINETDYRNKLTEQSTQAIVDLESQFPDRVLRAASGRIVTVDTTTINYGNIRVRSLDLRLAYERTFEATGRWTLQADAVRQLGYRLALASGQPAIDVADGADTRSPPRWAMLGTLGWDRGAWHATFVSSFVSGFRANTAGPFLDQATAVPSWTVFDVRAGYRFKDGIWRGRGRGLSVQLGIGNVADRDPPFANTVQGYNPGLHRPLGRTYDLSLRQPF